MKLNKTYLIISILLFIIEVLIAWYLKSGFIRHTFGDFLAVILLYSIVKSFLDINSFKLAIYVLVFAFIIEFLQLANILKAFNLENNNLIKTILGSTFQISDLVAYTLGIITILIIEYKICKLWIT
ncbi:Protein of unknown function [Flaviramulus basaltis]|uniref:DUF2809 domain-containing protein n=1 Tax=Flaviramulus basaltis TaxID=369401 RepID=A0A1K2IJU2_9FLAO|nr:DUF2809 domain-containing protein [Flaviramulus basaltis]SFZ92713.1 Protein of unknown function [Flaviramulus basaltis]